MADKKLTELDELTDVAGDDWLYVVDVSDTTHGGNGTSKKLKASKVYQGYANVLEYGADPTGDSDSATAFQNAVDSDYPVYAPPGKYRLDSAIIVDKPKIIDFGDASTRTITPESDTEQVRLIKTNNTGFFEIRSGQVYGFGGCFDTQNATGWNKDVFRYPIVANGSVAGGEGDRDGWAGGWWDFTYIGNLDELPTLSNGGNVIHIDTDQTVNFAYLYFHKWRGHVWRAGRAFYAPARNDGYNQSLNNCDIDLEVNDSRQAVFNESINRLKARIRHQSNKNVFDTEADAQTFPSVHSTGNTCTWDCVFFDFRQNGASTFGNYYSWNVASGDGEDVMLGPSNGLQWVESLSGVEPFGFERQSGIFVTTSNNAADKDNTVNQLFKRAGYQVYFSDINRTVWATGSGETDPWADDTGTTVTTPS